MKQTFRKLAAALAAAVLLLCLGGGQAAASGGVSGELVIYSSMYPFALAMMDEALKAEFPDLKPGNGDSFFIYGGSTSLINEIYRGMKAGRLECDMMLVAEPSLALELKEAGYLEKVEIPDAASVLRFPYDEEGYWYPVRVCNMVLAYNPELEADWAARGVSIPRTFAAFARDKSLKGLIGMGDPMFSGTTFAAVVSLIQANHYGRDYMIKLARNEVKLLSGSASIAGVQEGTLAAVMILEESVLKALKDAEDAGTPLTNLKCIYPDDGVILIPSPVMTVADKYSWNGNSAAAAAVEKWLLTAEAQEIILKAYMHSVFASMDGIPYGSMDTKALMAKDLGVNWENAYQARESINTAWSEIVLVQKQKMRQVDTRLAR